MVRSSRCLVAAVCIAFAFSALPGCESAGPGTGDKKTDEASFKGGPMPPDAQAKMQAAMQHGSQKKEENHAPAAPAH